MFKGIKGLFLGKSKVNQNGNENQEKLEYELIDIRGTIFSIERGKFAIKVFFDGAEEIFWIWAKTTYSFETSDFTKRTKLDLELSKLIEDKETLDALIQKELRILKRMKGINEEIEKKYGDDFVFKYDDDSIYRMNVKVARKENANTMSEYLEFENVLTESRLDNSCLERKLKNLEAVFNKIVKYKDLNKMMEELENDLKKIQDSKEKIKNGL